MHATQRGLTLIELMIVIAIVGILSAVALPAYQDYTIRAQMAEALVALAEAKNTVTEYYMTNGALPANAAEAGLRGNINSPVVKSVTWNANSITLAINDIGGDTEEDQTLLLSPTVNDGIVEWRCRPGTVAAKYLPANCRS